MSIDLSTCDSAAKLKIPSGIKSGQMLRMKKKGLNEVNRNRRGDQLIRVNIKTLNNISSNTKNILKALKEELGDWNEGVSGHVYIPFRTYEKSREPLRVEKFEFKKDVMVYGVLNLEGGHYEGEVKNLEPHGFGTHTSIRDGEKIKGRWQEGELVADKEDLAIEETENFYEDYE